jgi:hypothetical protein
VTLHDISATLFVMPTPTEPPHSFPTELQRTTLINTLAFSNAFPESLREHLLAPWSEELSMPDRSNPSIPYCPSSVSNCWVTDLSYTPESQSDARHPHHTPGTTRSTNSIQGPSVESTHLPVPRRISLSRYRSPSPNSNINQLRKVLSDGFATIPRSHEDVPKIEVNGEEVGSPTPQSSFTPPLLEKDPGDVTSILMSLVGGGEGDKEVDDGGVISPPYGI